MVCQRPNLKEARRIANNLIERLLGNLLEMANECTDNAYISSSAMPSLLEYMISSLKEEELKTHLVAGDTTPYQRCSLVEQTINESILNLHEWDKKCATHPDRNFILDTLEDWPVAIQLGIFRPEMV